MGIRILGLRGVPEVRPGDDLAAMAREAAEKAGEPVDGRSVLVIAQKIVSKAEGAMVDLRTMEPCAFAREWAAQWQRDPRMIELVLRESRRIVKMDRGVIIAETRHGLVTANAGVDQSNLPGVDLATVLPRDPDASARRIREGTGYGAVIVSDTFGRPWREGLVNVAIGVAGMAATDDLRGTADGSGKLLQGTIVATADELAAAAGLAMAKAARVPMALITGAEWKPGEDGARPLLRLPERDLFR